MSELINEIREDIDTEWLSEYLGENYAEELEYTDYNIEILKIDIDDLKSESYESIEHIGYVENEDWDTLITLVSEKEVKAIQESYIRAICDETNLTERKLRSLLKKKVNRISYLPF